MPFDESDHGLVKEVLRKYSNLNAADIGNLLLGMNKTLEFNVAETILEKVNQGKIEAADIHKVAKVIEILNPLMSFQPELYLSQCEGILEVVC